MKSFSQLGNYPPNEARRIFSALEQAGIQYRAKFFDGVRSIDPGSASNGGGCGGTARVLISIDSSRLVQVDKIHKELFCDCLPNFDSSFFTDGGDAVRPIPPSKPKPHGTRPSRQSKRRRS